MNRRSFLRLLGFAPLLGVAAKLPDLTPAPKAIPNPDFTLTMEDGSRIAADTLAFLKEHLSNQQFYTQANWVDGWQEIEIQAELPNIEGWSRCVRYNIGDVAKHLNGKGFKCTGI